MTIDKEKGGHNKRFEGICYRCGGKNHWSRICRTPKHLVDLYQKSIKDKGKQKVETNFVNNEGDHGNFDATHLDVADFFTNPDENIDHLMSDGNIPDMI
ncbi:hypothetical protein L3H42_11025 [Corynebacterium sp. MC-13]|nr:hypothetical protein [Corynebacterium parakroppenstedtii]